MPSNPQSFMFVFPGQGAQYRGMGRDIYESFAVARSVYRRASEALGYDMAELSFLDPGDELHDTAFTQPALLIHSIACMEVFRELTDGQVTPDIVAGHSLGEYTALVAAGALGLEHAVRLVRRRGELMSRYGKGKMLAVRLSLDEIRGYAERHYCDIGGCNLPDQTVVGGLKEDLEALVTSLRAAHPRVRPIFLSTEGAFHTYLMADAAMHFRAELEKTDFGHPACRILSNFTGDFHESDPAGIRYRLFFQLFHPVRWIAGLQRALAQGIGMIVEFGGGLGGESPASKRPNLASIIQRAIRAREGRFGAASNETTQLDHESLYAPGINVESLQRAANLAKALRRLKPASNYQHPGPDSDPICERWYRLYIPTIGGMPIEAATALMQQVEELGLGRAVQLVTEDASTNRSFIEYLDPESKGPAPYLEMIVGGESGILVYELGSVIEQELYAVHRETLLLGE